LNINNQDELKQMGTDLLLHQKYKPRLLPSWAVRRSVERRQKISPEVNPQFARGYLFNAAMKLHMYPESVSAFDKYFDMDRETASKNHQIVADYSRAKMLFAQQLKPVDPPNNLVDNFIPNARVSHAPDWRWNDQDKGGPGILLDDKNEGWAHVRFCIFIGAYRIGDEYGGHDTVYGATPKVTADNLSTTHCRLECGRIFSRRSRSRGAAS
jgi:hypothetical protein